MFNDPEVRLLVQRARFELAGLATAGKLRWLLLRAWIVPFVLYYPLAWLWDRAFAGAITPLRTLWAWAQWYVVCCLVLIPLVDRPFWPAVWLATAIVTAFHL